MPRTTKRADEYQVVNIALITTEGHTASSQLYDATVQDAVDRLAEWADPKRSLWAASVTRACPAMIVPVQASKYLPPIIVTMAYVLDQAALNRRAGHKPDAMLTPNVVTGRMARGYVLSENAGDGCWWLTSPSGHDRRVPAIVAEQLVNEGMVEIADKVRNMVSTTYRLTNRGGM